MAINFTYDEATNRVVVTGGTEGTPATFADFVTADRAGVDTILLSAGTPASDLALTYAVRPVEDLAIKVKCVVANKSAEADFIFITGKDWRGAAQTESIDVTAGNGSYTTTKYWSEITTLDCSDNAAGGGVVWADGDLSVTQDVWGVIWDYGASQYRIDATFNIGDGSSTYFRSLNESIFFGINRFSISGNATLSIGTLSNGQPVNGSRWHFTGASNQQVGYGTIYVYASIIDFHWAGSYKSFDFTNNVTAILKDVIIQSHTNLNSFWIRSTGVTIDTLILNNLLIAFWVIPSTIPLNVLVRTASGGGAGLQAIGANVLAKGVSVNYSSAEYLNASSGGALPSILHAVDSTLGAEVVKIEAADGEIYRDYTINIHVADKDGANLAGVTVDCEDQFGAAVWAAGTITTNAGGDIAEQIITYKKWEGTSETLTTYSPHKFTISKAGYETMVLDAVTVDAPIVWHLELLDELAEGDVRDGIAYGEDSEGNLELPAVGDVESGVGYGSNGVEFTGDFEVPPEADVRDGEGYGAGGAEFEGDLDLPAIGDVEKGVQFDSLTKTGTFKSPAEADVRDGEGYGEDDTEFTGTLDLPAEADVEDGVIFDGATKEGNFEAPAEADVEDGIGYGSNGVEFTGIFGVPAEDDVEDGVGYGAGGVEFEGNLEVPVIGDVRDGIGFGADGTELVGVLDLPSISDVKLHTIFDNGTKEGTYICPIPAGEMIAYLEESTEIEGYLEESTNLTGEIES